MKFAVLALINVAFSFAAHGDKCREQMAQTAGKVFSPLFSQIDNIRNSKQEAMANPRSEEFLDLRGRLSKIITGSEFFRTLPAQVDYDLVEALTLSENLGVTTRDIFQTQIERARKKRGIEIPTLSDLETSFDPNRVIQIQIETDQASEIASGSKTLLIQAGRKTGLKTGRGLLAVNGSGPRIPIEITEISWKKGVMELTAQDLAGEGKTTEAILQEKNLGAAQLTLLRRLANHYKGMKFDADLTLIRFTVLDSEASKP